MAVVQSFQSESPPTLEDEEDRLFGCKGDLAVVDGESGGDAAPGLDEATGEEGA